MKNSYLDSILPIINNNIQQTLVNNHKDYYIIGISGGIDSCLALRLLIDTVGKQHIKAYYLPIETNKNQSDVNLIQKTFDISIPTIDLTVSWQTMINNFGLQNIDNKNNLKSKIRNMFLYAMAFEHNGLVVSCLNYDEYYLGYFTKFGDSNGDIYPLINFLKQDIYTLANQFQLPLKIIDKTPSADLYENQTDEAELQLNYSVIDQYLFNKEVDPTSQHQIERWKSKNAHKHTLNDFIFNQALRKVN